VQTKQQKYWLQQQQLQVLQPRPNIPNVPLLFNSDVSSFSDSGIAEMIAIVARTSKADKMERISLML